MVHPIVWIIWKHWEKIIYLITILACIQLILVKAISIILCSLTQEQKIDSHLKIPVPVDCQFGKKNNQKAEDFIWESKTLELKTMRQETRQTSFTDNIRAHLK